MASRILGPNGRPYQPADLQAPARATAGGTLSASAEDEATGLTPVRLAALLRATEDGETSRYFALAERLEERWAHYAAVLGVRKRQVAQLPIYVESADDSAAAQRDAELVRNWVKEPMLEGYLFDLLDAVGKGISITEVIWETSEKSWWPRALHWVDPRWVRFDFKTLSRPFLNCPPYDQELKGPRWMIHRVQAKSGVPVRTGIARTAAWYWLFSAFGVRGWVAFAEAYGQPLRLGKFPTTATDAECRQLLQALQAIGQDAAVVIPETMNYELITDAARSATADVHERLLKYLEQSISKLVLGQTMATDDGSSLGQAKVHDEVRADIERADALQLSATLTKALAEPLVAFNHGPRDHYPKIVIAREDVADLEYVIHAVEKLGPQGLTVSKTALRRRLGLPPPTDAEDTLGGGVQAPTKGVEHLGATRATVPAADAFEALTQELLGNEGWQPLMSPVVHALQEILSGATSLEAAKLALAAQGIPVTTEALNNALVAAGFASRLAGESGELD